MQLLWLPLWYVKNVKHYPLPIQAPFVNWVAEVEDEACSGCGLCLESCWMNGMKMEIDMAVCDDNLCIGCGLCKYVCTTDALKKECIEIFKKNHSKRIAYILLPIKVGLLLSE